LASVTRFVGADAQLGKLKKLIKFSPDEFARALAQEVEGVEVPECKRVCPKLSGDLSKGIHMEGPQRDGRRIVCSIVTSAAQDHYALKIHEDPDLNHTNGEWKYIENPLKESAPYMKDRIAARIDLNKAL